MVNASTHNLIFSAPPAADHCVAVATSTFQFAKSVPLSVPTEPVRNFSRPAAGVALMLFRLEKVRSFSAEAWQRRQYSEKSSVGILQGVCKVHGKGLAVPNLAPEPAVPRFG